MVVREVLSSMEWLDNIGSLFVEAFQASGSHPHFLLDQAKVL